MNTENIIELARQGNQLAIRQLYNTYSSRMIATSLKILGNYDEALEVAHDAFLLAISHLHTLKHPDRIEPWINSITHNLALRHKQSLASTTFIPLFYKIEKAEGKKESIKYTNNIFNQNLPASAAS